MATVRQVSLFRREIREGVSPAGFELLLSAASTISEGQITAGGRYYGSTMLTLDLRQAHCWIRDACDMATALRLTQLLEKEPHLIGAVRKVALDEARRLAGRELGQLEADVRARADGCRIFLDVDVEGVDPPLALRNRR